MTASMRLHDLCIEMGMYFPDSSKEDQWRISHGLGSGKENAWIMRGSNKEAMKDTHTHRMKRMNMSVANEE